MLRNSKFDAEEIDREKGVIVEEMNMYYDTPRDFLEGVYDELLYGDTPLGWDIIGTKETVRSATRETFLEYLDRWYRAPRMVAGLAGAIGDDAVGRLEELLGDVPDGGEGTPPPAEPNTNGTPVKVHTKQSDQAHVRLGVHSYPLDHPDRYALNLLATALGGGMSSRLFTEVRERRGLAYYVYGYNQGYTDAGTLYAQGGVDIKRIDEAITTIAGEFERIAAEPLEEDELSKARNFAKGRLVLSLEDPKGTIMFGLRGEVLEGRVREPDEVLAGFDARDGRGRAAGRPGRDRDRPPPPGGDRPVRGRSTLRGAAGRTCLRRRAPLRRQVVREVREALAAVGCDSDQVFQPAAAEALPVQARLDRDDVAFDERAAGAAETRLLVHLEPDAVSEAVEEALVRHLARLLRELSLVAGLLEGAARDCVELLARHACADRLVNAVERLAAQPVELDEQLGRLADAERARHVRVAARLRVLREEVADDRLAGLDRPVTRFVADRRLRAVRDDQRIGGRETVLRERAERDGLELLARNLAALAEPGSNSVHRGLGAPLRAPDPLQLGAALHPAPLVEEVAVRP